MARAGTELALHLALLFVPKPPAGLSAPPSLPLHSQSGGLGWDWGPASAMAMSKPGTTVYGEGT